MSPWGEGIPVGSPPVLCLQTHVYPTPVACRNPPVDWLDLYEISLSPMSVRPVLHSPGSLFLIMASGGWVDSPNPLDPQPPPRSYPPTFMGTRG